jgi:hypothetical protein
MVAVKMMTAADDNENVCAYYKLRGNSDYKLEQTVAIKLREKNNDHDY